MKPFHNSLFNSLLFLLCLTLSLVSYAQDSGNAVTNQNDNLKSLLEKKSFVFLARSVSPTGGGIRHLTSTYTLSVDSATVVSDLPYFGRVYQPEYGGDAGLTFTSRDFDYKTEPGKKGKVIIQIKTKDLKNDFQLRLQVFTDGNATLQVSGADRQSISYSGEIAAPKK